MSEIQRYNAALERLDHPQKSKIAKILSYGCLKKVNRDAWICRPITGYNKTTYTLYRRPDGTFKCNCQGFNKRGSCSHQYALDIVLTQEGDQKQGTLFAAIASFMICLLIAGNVYAAEPPIWQVLMAEAVSEGEQGMYAVACVIRNRGTDRGLVGRDRADLDEFCLRQGRWSEVAKRVERAVIANNAPDITGGATHFENVEIYGEPYWARNMVITAKIGCHTFYKEKE